MTYITLTTQNDFYKYTIGAKVQHLIIKNDGANPFTFSSDGSSILGRLDASESITYDFINQCGKEDIVNLFIRATVPGGFTAVRIWAW